MLLVELIEIINFLYQKYYELFCNKYGKLVLKYWDFVVQIL